MMHINWSMSGFGQVLKEEEELQTKGLVLLVDARGVGFGLLRRFTGESFRPLVLARFLLRFSPYFRTARLSYTSCHTCGVVECIDSLGFFHVAMLHCCL